MELMKLMEDWDGYASFNERGIRHTDAEITSFNKLLSNAAGDKSHLHEYKLKEALTTSDFPYLFGDVLDRQVLASYKAVDPVWKAFTKMSTVRDFKTAYRFAITNGDQYLAEVAEKGEYLASDREEDKYEIAVKKYGRQFDISWETLINDDLGALQDTPKRFATAAIRTEHRILTNRYANDYDAVSHANAGALYSDGGVAPDQSNATDALLTIANLETGLETMAAFHDANSEPIMNRAKYLVVPPSLEMTARQILSSTSKMWTAAAGAAIAYPTNNVVAQMGLTLIVDPYMPIMDTSDGETSWYLFADPNDIAALEFAHLRGHERPEICMKASDKVNVGGGPIGPMEGDFATDNVFYRVRLVCGVTRLDWRATYAGGLVNSI